MVSYVTKISRTNIKLGKKEILEETKPTVYKALNVIIYAGILTVYDLIPDLFSLPAVLFSLFQSKYFSVYYFLHFTFLLYVFVPPPVCLSVYLSALAIHPPVAVGYQNFFSYYKPFLLESQSEFSTFSRFHSTRPFHCPSTILMQPPILI